MGCFGYPETPLRFAQGRARFGASSGEVAEWLMAADCKSALERVHRFKSYPHHQ
jgi:hypothetical protein